MPSSIRPVGRVFTAAINHGSIAPAASARWATAVDFNGIFSRLTQYGYSGWAALEWECCLKNPQDGAREGAAFIRDRIIHVTDKVFDDFAGAPVNPQQINALLGIR